METAVRTGMTELVASPRILGTLDAWQSHLAGRKMRIRACESYGRELRLFVRSLGDEASVADVTTPSIERYQNALSHLAASTIRKKLSAIRSWCRWCVKVSLRIDDPTLNIEWPKRPKKVPRALKTNELELLEAALDAPLPLLDLKARRIGERNRRIVLLLLYCGLRRAEVAGLRWSDVDLDERTLLVRSETAKGGIERIVTIHPRVIEELSRTPRSQRRGAVAGHKDGRCLSHKTIGSIFERWLNDKGLRIHAHQLRHTCATQLLLSGASLIDIQKVLGHADIRTTEGYLDVVNEQQRRAVDRLPNRFA